MNVGLNSGAPVSPEEALAQTTSELNNLLQIISGTSSSLGHVCAGNPASQPYLATLHATIERAEKLSANLVKQAGGPVERALTNDQFTADSKARAPVTNGKKKSQILVVDDEQVTLGLVSRILGEADFEVT